MGGSEPTRPGSNRITTILLIVAAIVLVFGLATSNLIRPLSQRTDQLSIEILQPNIDLDISTFNGAIQIEPVDSEAMTMKIIMRGAEDDLERTSIDSGNQNRQDTKLIWLHASFQGPTLGGTPSVSLEVQAPRNKIYTIKLETSNGRVTLSNLEGRELEIHISNGELVLTGLRFDDAECETSNGRIEASIASGNAAFSTSNGEIELDIDGDGRYRATSSNGGVDVRIRIRTEVRVYASTSNARIEWQGPTLITEQSTQTLLVGQTERYSETGANVDLRIQTSNGGISISAES